MTGAPALERFIVVGAGAQGRVVLESWRAQRPGGAFELVDDAPELAGSEVLGASVLGPVAMLERVSAWVVIGIGRNPARLAMAERLGRLSVRFATVVHPSCVVSPSAVIGPGSVVLPGGVIHTQARIGAHVVVNTGSIVEHDCVLEDGASVCPGVRMGGRVRIGRGAYVATGATLAPRVRVGDGAIVGAGAVAVADVPPGMLAYGVPARAIRPVVPDDWSRVS